MQDWVIEIMNRFGYLGTALLIAVENIFPPIPSEVILTFGGFMTTTADISAVGMILAATVGSLLGAVVLYGIGRLLPPERLERLLELKLCRMLGFKKGDIQKTVDWFARHGKSAVLLGRCVPIIRSLISIPAGMSKMPLPLFFLFTTLGSAIWNTALVILGVVAGASWEKIVEYCGIYAWITLAVLGTACVIGGGIFLYYRWKKNKQE